jgi:hypothetical protein
VDGVVKRTKGLRLGSAKRYGVYEAEGVGIVLAMECLRQEADEQIGTVPLGLDNQAAIHATTSIFLATRRPSVRQRRVVSEGPLRS